MDSEVAGRKAGNGAADEIGGIKEKEMERYEQIYEEILVAGLE